jgi:hypothetical protein
LYPHRASLRVDGHQPRLQSQRSETQLLSWHRLPG